LQPEYWTTAPFISVGVTLAVAPDPEVTIWNTFMLGAAVASDQEATPIHYHGSSRATISLEAVTVP
jgi:hypothetical protein